jgi:hypothetical protein
MALISKSIWQRFLLLSGKDFLSFVRQIFFTSNVPAHVFFNQSCSFQTFGAFFVHFDRFCAFCTIFRDFSAQIDESFRKTNEGAVASAPSGIAQAMSEGVVQQPFV